MIRVSPLVDCFRVGRQAGNESGFVYGLGAVRYRFPCGLAPGVVAVAPFMLPMLVAAFVLDALVKGAALCRRAFLAYGSSPSL
jgi:hypothetical protein